MRVLLKMKETGLYYGGAGQLNAECGDAMEFATVPAAAQCAVTEQLTDAEVVLRCDYLDSEIPLAVSAELCALHQRYPQTLESSEHTTSVLRASS